MTFAGSRGVTLAAMVASAVLLAAPDAGKAAEASPVSPAPTVNGSRAPADIQRLTDLSFILGEAHALRRVCAGPQDGYWYELMQRLIQNEHPDASLRRRLIDRFNEGFAARAAEYPACTSASRAAARDTARRGEVLSRGMIGDAVTVHP